ncbi:molybdopterin-guanine dinucleotide biosynthesis protein B [Magnetospirillum sp. UT-4]|uniref:molybdopterin-guanine dinucleotide biosynthesis protein B n=1 Tax=Magnetospirillum sp. UT-4 TaxID=2681467 RepID=UPI00137C6898|nr:molybdopterin-guanine dinucleotide biosynthesis protein B [Magnetospirillum sp. UT-4]CAA7613948.1 Molybdopterin-guanine dinucleotide biosynthesis adapter protein [Magnetospirillum sp. UT-4]
MKLFGIVGWSGSGKTTLLVRLIPALTRRGIAVATLKHTHHPRALGGGACEVLAEAGAVETVTASPERFALIRHHHQGPEPDLADLVPRFVGIDLLLVEGFKFAGMPKLEVWDPALDMPMLALSDPHVAALASDAPVDAPAVPLFRRDDIAGIAAFVLETCGLS